MDKLVSGDLWKEIKRLAKKSKRRMAAVAYVTNDEIVTFKDGDLLIVDASNQSIKSGQTSALLLHKAFERGAALYSCPGLHAKVMLLDNVAVIGSANISRSSEQSLIEAAYITDHPSAVAMTRALIQQLQDISTSVDASFIRRINSIEVNRAAFRGFHGAKKQGVSVKLKTPRTWIVSLHNIDEDRYQSEAHRVEKGVTEAEQLLNKPTSEVGWIRCAGSKSRFVKDARETDTVIQIWKDTDKSKKPYAVGFRAPILLRQKEPNCIRFFVEQPANSDKTSLTWKQFTDLTKSIKLPFAVKPNTSRLLPDEYSVALAALWKKQQSKRP